MAVVCVVVIVFNGYSVVRTHFSSFLVGWWSCVVTAKNMGVADPGSIVWDEIVAFWLVLLVISPTGFWGQCLGFVLFRFFDAVKFGPVAWADQTFKGFGARGGFGIMFDDLVAAFCTLLLLALWRSIFSLVIEHE